MGRYGGARDDDDGDRLISKRMPYCMAMLVLLAIVYVLARYVVGRLYSGEGGVGSRGGRSRAVVMSEGSAATGCYARRER